ncbi:orotidine-5'-phosphate decarboxylase [Halomonas denitrificans]|nr:orotidine-5'-phosphate decarboxylase [Halomonas denitrificans]
MSTTPAIDDHERLIFALDVPDAERARALIRALGDHVSHYKLGLELFLSGAYFELADELNAAGKRVFADLKLFDVPATVGRAVAQLARRGVDFITVHGQDAMLAEAAANKGAARILAVTALTSLDQGDLDALGFDCDVADLVLSRARRALALGCDGVVSSGLEAPALRAGTDPALVVVCPGIRPVANTDDQKRTLGVAQAFANGADYIVVGRPIRDAEDPAAAAEAIQTQIRAAIGADNQ